MISIIMPAYNAEHFIAATIESVLQQTYSDWELIIVNDGSTDGTVNVVKKFLSDKIKLVSQKNAGVSTTRNNGLLQASGNYIAFLDADDFWMPDNLQDKYDLLQNNPTIDFTFSNFYIGDINLSIVEKGPTGSDENMLEGLLLWNRTVIPGASSNLLLRKKCFENGLRFDSQFSSAADQDFSFYLVKNFKGKHLNAYTWIYRIYSTSMSKNMTVVTKDHVGVYKKAAKNNLFKNFIQKQKSFSVMYLTMAGGWWVHGNNKMKSIKYMLLAIGYNPASFFKLLRRSRLKK